jgi:hypothetical protein
MGVSGQRHAPAAHFTPGTHWIGGWVGLRAGLDAGARRKILCPCRGSNPALRVSNPIALLEDARELDRLCRTENSARVSRRRLRVPLGYPDQHQFVLILIVYLNSLSIK